MDLSVAKSWLDRYYAVKEFYVDRDGSTTTLVSCGAVLLAAIVAGSRTVQTLTTLTGLPAAFIEATLLVADSGGHFLSDSHGRLIIAVTQHPADFEWIEEALNNLMCGIWETMDNQWPDALSILRARSLYGGNRQTWTYGGDEHLCLHTIARAL